MADISHYNPAYVQEVDKYLKKHKDRYEKYIKQKNSEKGYLMYDKRIKVKIPTVEGFAVFIGVTKKTLYNWEKDHEDFADALDKIVYEQKERLINMGLSGEYNPTIAKLLLSHNHGMKERSDVTTDDEPINNSFTDEQANRIAERIVERRTEKDGGLSSSEELD